MTTVVPVMVLRADHFIWRWVARKMRGRRSCGTFGKPAGFFQEVEQRAQAGMETNL